jgi:hypothetical protein
MTDLDDILEAVIDIEEIAEEVFDPEELVEDLIKEPLKIFLALVAAIAGVLTLILVLVTIIFVFLAVGAVAALITLAGITLMATILAIGGFIYFKTDIPSHLDSKINKAMEKADSEPRSDEKISEKEAIEKIKKKYTNGEMTEKELEQAIDRILNNEDHREIMKSYNLSRS